MIGGKRPTLTLYMAIPGPDSENITTNGFFAGKRDFWSVIPSTKMILQTKPHPLTPFPPCQPIPYFSARRVASLGLALILLLTIAGVTAAIAAPAHPIAPAESVSFQAVAGPAQTSGVIESQTYTIWTAPSSVKLWTNSAPIQWTEPLRLARNDGVSFHVALAAKTALSLPTLTATSPTLSVKVWQEAPISIQTPSPGLNRVGAVLDALIPAEATVLRQQFATVPAGETRAWLVEVHTTAATAPGHHTISLKVDGQTWDQDVVVYDVVLNNMPTLKTAFGTTGTNYNAGAALAHGITDALRSEQRYKLLDLYHDDMAANELSPYFVQWPAVFRGAAEATMLQVYYDCTNDRMVWNQDILDLLSRHLNASKPSASTFLFAYGAYRYESSNRFMLCGLGQDDPGFEAVAEKFFAAVARDMAARGWLQRVGFFADEPMPSLRRTADWWEPLPFDQQTASVQRVVRAASASAKAGIFTGVAMPQSYQIEFWTQPSLLAGRTPFNRWIFLTDGRTSSAPDHPDEYDLRYDAYMQPGDEKWTYWVNAQPLQADAGALSQILPGIEAYKYGTTGILSWSILDMDTNPWVKIATSWGNGSTHLYYPPCGPANCTSVDYTLIPSLRIKLLAEGIRFHQYLTLLEQRGGRDVARYVGDVDELVPTAGVYSQDWRRYEATRQAVLEALTGEIPVVPTPTVTPTPTMTPTSTPVAATSVSAYDILLAGAQVDGSLGEYIGPPISFGTATARLQWDMNALYVGVSVIDDQVLTPQLYGPGGQCKLWTTDSIELFVDALNNGGGAGNPDLPWMEPDDIQIIVSAASELLDLRGTANKTATADWNGHEQAIAKVTATGFNVEIAIPWSDLGIQPSSNTIIGLSLAQNDKDSTTTTSVQWQQQGLSFQNAGTWPRVRLIDQTQPTATPTATPSPTPTNTPTATSTHPQPRDTPTTHQRRQLHYAHNNGQRRTTTRRQPRLRPSRPRRHLQPPPRQRALSRAKHLRRYNVS